MRFLVRVVFYLLVVLSFTAPAYSQTQSRQQPAEAAADKIVRRFYDTLDFGDVYREFYINNPTIRKAEVEIVMGNMIRQGDLEAKPEQLNSRRIDFAAMERSYICFPGVIE